MNVGINIISKQEVLGKSFTVYGTFEYPLFLAKDVAYWIDYDASSINKLVNLVDDCEKARMNVPTQGGKQEAWFLTEDGLYEVLMQSRKPIAKAFKKEVKRILKELRTKGITATPATIDAILSDPDFGIRLLTDLKEERQKRISAERVAEEKTVQLDESKEWYTIKRFAKENGLNWRRIDWRALKAVSYEHDYPVKKIFDANYGKVNIYHKDIFRILFGL